MNKKSKYQRLLNDTSIKKRHVKLYKVGKLWVAMGITVAALGMASFSTTALAATDDTTTTTSAINQSKVTATQSTSVNTSTPTKAEQVAD